MAENKENLNELLGQFFEAQDLTDARNTFRIGDTILDSHRAPEVDIEVLDGIIVKIGETLSSRRDIGGLSILGKVAAVAVVVLIALAGLQYFGNGEQNIFEPSAAMAQIWNEDDQNGKLAEISAEVDEVAESILAIRLGEENEQIDALDEVEQDVNESYGDFWKG